MKSFPLFLFRLGLGLVFLWFGVDKFIHTSLWLSYITPAMSELIPFSQGLFIHTLGIIEIVLGGFLILGLFVRLVALFIALHLFFVVLTLGLNDVAVRDIGLMITAIALALIKKHPYRIVSGFKK